MKRILFVAIAFLAAATAFPQTAVFKELSGKVEYQLAGKEWRPARAGVEVPRGTMISTGFKSMALIVLGKASVLVKPLTRLSIDEIVRVEGSEAAKLFLLAGRVRVEANTESGTPLDFSVRSPTATASVRGCAFNFDGPNLEVFDGEVLYASAIRQVRVVARGETSRLTDSGAVEAPRVLKQRGSIVICTSDFGFQSGDAGQGIIPPPSGILVVAIE
jgi:hypothetical protein